MPISRRSALRTIASTILVACTNGKKPPQGLDPILTNAGVDQKLNNQVPIEAKFRDAPTSYIWAHPAAFRVANVEHDRKLRGLRWTLDYPEDLVFVEAVYEAN